MRREVVTLACPECVGASPVEDWSRLDPCCPLCVGCGRIDVDQPARPASPEANRRSGRDVDEGRRRR